MDSENNFGMYHMHVELIKMLFDFNKICKKADITYSLGFGSMLGAVREHGIIPWDDDIDVIIDRTNFAKLQNAVDSSAIYVLERENSETLWVPRFRYRNKKSREYAYELTIDVFIIDNVPDSKWLARIKMLTIFALQGMIKHQLNLKKGNAIQKVASLFTYIVGRLFPISFKFYVFNKLVVFPKHSEECACYTAEFAYAKYQFNSRLLEETIEMEFDGCMIPVSKNYDSYLTKIYGDYMTPPEKSEQIPKHFKDCGIKKI